jgi:protein TonB
MSLILHLSLLIVPQSWWDMAGGAVQAPAGSEDAFPVSLFELPAASAPEAPVPPTSDAVPAPQPAAATPAEEEKPDEAAAEAEPSIDPAASGVGSSGEPSPTPAAGAERDGVEGEVMGEGGGEVRYRPPRLLAGALPIDPEESERLKVPAEIPVRLRVGTDGRVLEIVPEDPDLAAPVQEALERSAEAMRFVPAYLGSEPVEAWFSMTFIYRR